MAAAPDQKFDYDFSELATECINLPKEIGAFFGTLTVEVISLQVGSIEDFDVKEAEKKSLVFSRIDAAFQERIQNLREAFDRLSKDLQKSSSQEIQRHYSKTRTSFQACDEINSSIWSKLFIIYFWAQNNGQIPRIWNQITHLSVIREYYSDWLKRIEDTQAKAL